MTETPYAIAHDYALVAPAPDGVADAIAGVMLQHVDELRAALEPFGVAFEDLLDPTWMRAVRIGDVKPFSSAPRSDRGCGPGEGCSGDGCACTAPAEVTRSYDVDPAMHPAVEHIDQLLGGAGCCGSGEACSSAACTGTPREVFPEPRQDAAVFGAPSVTRGGIQFNSAIDEPRHGDRAEGMRRERAARRDADELARRREADRDV